MSFKVRRDVKKSAKAWFLQVNDLWRLDLSVEKPWIPSAINGTWKIRNHCVRNYFSFGAMTNFFYLELKWIIIKFLKMSFYLLIIKDFFLRKHRQLPCHVYGKEPGKLGILDMQICKSPFRFHSNVRHLRAHWLKRILNYNVTWHILQFWMAKNHKSLSNDIYFTITTKIKMPKLYSGSQSYVQKLIKNMNSISTLMQILLNYYYVTL